MQDNTEQIRTNFAKNRALQDNEGQILKVRTMQDNAGLYKPCICKLCLDTRMLFGPCKVRKQ